MQKPAGQLEYARDRQWPCDVVERSKVCILLVRWPREKMKFYCPDPRVKKLQCVNILSCTQP